MKRLAILSFFLVSCLEAFQPPCHKGAALHLQGTVEKIEITPGAGMPVIEVKTGKTTERVFLGSMRFLMEQNFNPRAGDEVVVDGVRDGENILALTVEIPARKIRLQLRDSQTCVPMWRRRGRHRH